MKDLDKLIKAFEMIKDVLSKNDALDDKIAQIMRQKIQEKWGDSAGVRIADHYRDIDESIPAKQRSNIKAAIQNQRKKDNKLRLIKAIELADELIESLSNLNKSNYGPKDMGLYNPVDNIKRKKRNTGDEIKDIGANKNVKAYSTKPGQLSAKQQAALDFKNIKAKSGPVKLYTKEEIEKLVAEGKIKKSEEIQKNKTYNTNYVTLPDKSGWKQHMGSGSFHHPLYGVISTYKTPEGKFSVKYSGKELGTYDSIDDAAAKIKDHMNWLGSIRQGKKAYPSVQGKVFKPKNPVIKSNEAEAANQLLSVLPQSISARLQPTNAEFEQEMLRRGIGYTPEQLEQIKKSEDGNKINDFFAEAMKPISSRFKSEEEELAYWNSIKVSDFPGEDSGY
jgi:hypothetical protein